FFWFIFISFIVFFSSVCFLGMVMAWKSKYSSIIILPFVNCLPDVWIVTLPWFFYHAILVTTLIVMFLNQLIHWIIQQPFYLKIALVLKKCEVATASFSLQNEAGQRPTEFCQENALILRRGGKNTQKNCTKKIFTTQIIMIVKASISALLTMPKLLTVWLTTNCGKFFKTWEYQTTLLIKPFFNMKPLSKADRERARNQKIPKLSELLEIARKANKLVIFDLNSPPRSHPARSSYIRLVVRVILDSKIEQHLIIWLPGSDRDYVRSKAPGFQHIGRLFTIEQLTKEKITRINVDYKNLFHNGLKEYKAANITINVYLVNEPWLFSLVWCSSIHSVTTDNLEVLKQINHPYYFMVKPLYLSVSVISSIMYILHIFLAFFIPVLLSLQTICQSAWVLLFDTSSYPFPHGLGSKHECLSV
ncbi:hypothetical protein FD754_015774, partial [Muntiacus muntjak]